MLVGGGLSPHFIIQTRCHKAGMVAAAAAVGDDGTGMRVGMGMAVGAGRRLRS